MTVAMTPGLVPGMFLASTGTRPVTVIGRAGEPFLRFTRERGHRGQPPQPELRGRPAPAG
ncbi:MAG: hypothetical protein WKF40_03900 [Thermoleophilaceae bacterium]